MPVATWVFSPSTTISRLMPSNRNRRWIWAVFFVTVFPVFAVHFSCVAVLGPGSWGSGVEEKAPLIEPARRRPDLAPYVEQWEAARNAEQATEAFPAWAIESLGDREGDIVWADRTDENGDAVVLTAGGKNWTEQQRLYLSTGSEAGLREVEIPSEMILRHPTFLKSGDQVKLVLGRWNSWAVSPTQKLSRYRKSWFDPTLRPEYSLFAYDEETGAFEILGPGGDLKPSPDRTKAVIVRSGALGTTLHSLHVWEPGSGAMETIASLSEADPGSGRSFDYGWSTDSKAVFIWGSAGGFRARAQERRELQWIYMAAEKKVFSID